MTDATPTADSFTLVIGGGGLLGRAVVDALRKRGWDHGVARVDWTHHPLEGLAASLDAVQTNVSRIDVIWCAGVGITATPQHVLDEELRVLREFLDRVRSMDTQTRAKMTFFYSSSAGGVYAGSSDVPPYSESSATGPLAPYGHAKLQGEKLVSSLTAKGVRVVIGRISNLYGPGQDLRKAQGLISQMCFGQATAQPVGIYVSLDTLRDYLFVKDCAEMLLNAIERAGKLEPGEAAVVKIFAAHRSTSIAALIGELRRISRRSLPIVISSSPGARQQARDLRFRSTVWPDLDSAARTPLGAGIAMTREDIGRRFRAGEAI